MSHDSPRCGACGATSPPGSGGFCSHCGRALGAEVAELPTALVVGGAAAPAGREVGPDALGAPPSAFGARFALARRDPGYDAAMTVTVKPPPPGVELVVPAAMMVFGFFFAVFWMAMAPAIMKLMGAGFFLVWFGILGTQVRRSWRRLAAPTERYLACAIDRATAVRQVSGRHGTGTISEERVTLELEDGRRLALAGPAAVLGTVVDGDVGVAYVKADQLIGFRRLRG